MTVVAAALGILSLAIFAFIELRSLLNHEWKTFLPLRLTVAITMLASAATAFFFLALDQAWPALIFLSLALLIGGVGSYAILERYGNTQKPPVATQTIQKTAAVALATIMALISALIYAFYS